MLILWIPLGVIIIYLLIRSVYLRIWDRGLTVDLAFGQHAVSEGQQATLKATVANAKLLPLPVLMLRYKMNRGLRMDENANATVSDMLNVVEYFSVLGNEQVVREQKVEATRRGCYHIDILNIMMPQLISGQESFLMLPQDTELIVYPRLLETPEMWGICEKIIGDIVSRRRLFEDVFSFRGIRDYTRTDPLSTVNWKATARTGKMMVNLRDYTFGQEVRILLNLEEPNYRYGDEVLENAIRIAATVACRCISDRIPVSLISNARIGVETMPDVQARREFAKTQNVTHSRRRLGKMAKIFDKFRKKKANAASPTLPAPPAQMHADEYLQNAFPREAAQTTTDSGNANVPIQPNTATGSGAVNGTVAHTQPYTATASAAANAQTSQPNKSQYVNTSGTFGYEDSLQIHAGGSQDHIAVIGEALARVDITREMEPFVNVLHRERENMADSYVTVCLISSGRSDAIIREAEALARQQDGIFWICPLRKEEADKNIPGKIDFRRVDF